MRLFISSFCLLICFFSLATSYVSAAPNYHWVGWFNTVVPGGGQFLLGNYGSAALELTLEGSTFGVGYAMSRLDPMTLDGVPEDLPIRGTSTVYNTKSRLVCVRFNSTTKKCDRFANRNYNAPTDVRDETERDFAKPIVASILQEFGIKYHMVNVFNAYREAATVDGKITDPWIDPRPTSEMFKDPFRLDTLSSPWVYAPIAGVLGISIYDYFAQGKAGIDPLSRMNTASNALFGFNYIFMQPFGSGAPEEMFFRGFVQNEFYHLVESPYFSVPMQTALFALAHRDSGRVGAAISGLYLGTLAHKNGGNLAESIAVHFWSVVILGIETTLLTLKAQGDVPPTGVAGKIYF